MDLQLLKTMGQIAGIGGLALGVFFLLFKDLLKKVVAPGLTNKQWFKVVVIFMFLVWSLALAGLGAWLWVGLGGKAGNGSPSTPGSTVLNASNVGGVHTGTGNIYVTYGYSKEEYLTLATNLAVKEATLDGFFRMVGLSNVPPESVQDQLVILAAEYRALKERIDKAPVKLPNEIETQTAATRELENGNLTGARKLADKLPKPPSKLHISFQ